MYVRMSSSPQDHSIEHQMDRLNTYADENGFEIVTMYADAGKSGLCINGHDGLQDLIADVLNGKAKFSAILVYDISRWAASRISTKAPITKSSAARQAYRLSISLNTSSTMARAAVQGAPAFHQAHLDVPSESPVAEDLGFIFL